jgi:hypothetical protein
MPRSSHVSSDLRTLKIYYACDLPYSDRAMNMLAKVKGIGRQKRRSGWKTTRTGGGSKG